MNYRRFPLSKTLNTYLLDLPLSNRKDVDFQEARHRLFFFLPSTLSNAIFLKSIIHHLDDKKVFPSFELDTASATFKITLILHGLSVREVNAFFRDFYKGFHDTFEKNQEALLKLYNSYFSDKNYKPVRAFREFPVFYATNNANSAYESLFIDQPSASQSRELAELASLGGASPRLSFSFGSSPGSSVSATSTSPEGAHVAALRSEAPALPISEKIGSMVSFLQRHFQFLAHETYVEILRRVESVFDSSVPFDTPSTLHRRYAHLLLNEPPSHTQQLLSYIRKQFSSSEKTVVLATLQAFFSVYDAKLAPLSSNTSASPSSP